MTDPGHLDGDAGSHASFEGWLSGADTGPQPQIGGGPPTGPRSAPSDPAISARSGFGAAVADIVQAAFR